MNEKLSRVIHKIKRTGVFFLKNYSIVLLIYNSFYRLINKRKFYREIKLRENISIFDYKGLSKQIPYFPIEKIKDANFYGHLHSLKKYAGVDKITHSIEHGLYLGNYVPYATFLKTTKSIITFSENRKKHLRNANIKKPIITIGPYIHYAEPLLSDKDFNEIKKSIGRTFLLFPTHSIKNIDVEIEIEDLISKVKKTAKDFDTIMVCFYYKDILNDIFPEYFMKAGFKIVTAGNIYDINFLSRLKSIIQLSDFTASNNVGTHTGYCIYLNKPHFIFKQNINYKKENSLSTINYRNSKQLESMEEEKNDILKEFTYFSHEITDNQRKIIDKYWGISSIKSPNELKDLLSEKY